jgi:hypothetical protein
VILIVGLLPFLPVRGVSFNESRNVPFDAGVDTIDLNFAADVAKVNVGFVDSVHKLVELNVLMNISKCQIV